MHRAGAPWTLPERGGTACQVPLARLRDSATGWDRAASGVVAEPTPASGSRGLFDRVPAWMLAAVAMLSVQVGSAQSTHLFSTVGSAGTAWLRLTAERSSSWRSTGPVSGI